MPSPGNNHFFSSLLPVSRERISAHLRQVALPVSTVLYQADTVPHHVFFLTSGVASQVITTLEGTTVEVGLVGREGLVGGVALLGPGLAPHRCFMQSDGAGCCIPFHHMRSIFLDSEDVRDRTLAFIQAQTVAAAYFAACNKLHATECRLARWLLMVQDRLETDLLPLTQEFIAQMLGTRRMTVVTAAGALQRSGIITYSRGHIRILRRDLLEAASCECYACIRAVYSNLYPA